MAALPGGFEYEDENDNAQASASGGNLPADRTSNLLGSGGRECANDGNTDEVNNDNTSSDNIDYITARLQIEELKLQLKIVKLNASTGQQ